MSEFGSTRAYGQTLDEILKVVWAPLLAVKR